NNAGVGTSFKLSKDNIELVFATNHLGTISGQHTPNRNSRIYCTLMSLQDASRRMGFK
ncbi:hypothetical protein MKX01_017887, partial [Papaver californicum]